MAVLREDERQLQSDDLRRDVFVAEVVGNVERRPTQLIDASCEIAWILCKDAYCGRKITTSTRAEQPVLDRLLRRIFLLGLMMILFEDCRDAAMPSAHAALSRSTQVREAMTL